MVECSRAVTVSLFEVPVVLRARRSGKPEEALNQQLEAGTLGASRYYGIAAGVVVWAAAASTI